MKKFDLGTFIGDPKLRHLVAVHYQQNEIRPITEYQVVMGSNLAVKDPYTDRLVLLDESAETRDEDQNWVSTVYLVEGIFTSRTMAEKLAALKPGEDIHFITNSRLDGYSVRRLYLFGADLFIARRWDCELSMYDATREGMNIHDMDLWLCDITGLNPDENMYQTDEQNFIEANHEWFNETYRLKNLRCEEEGWFIGDCTSHYRVEADDDHRDICPDDKEARRRAVARGIRFRGDDSLSPADLIYPKKRTKNERTI